MTSSEPERPPLQEQIDLLKQELEILHRTNRRRDENLLGVVTILCLPMSEKRKLEIGFALIKDLENQLLIPIIDRYLKECKKSEVSFDDIFDPMVRAIGFEKLWSVIDKAKIRDLFGEWALTRWIDMAKSHPCEK